MTANRTRRRPSPWRVGVVAGMASYIDAAAITGFAAAIVIYQTTLGFQGLEIGIAAGSLTAAIAIGALAGGRLGDRFGRKPIFSATMITILFGLVALMFAPNFAIVLIGAVLVGLGAGADLPVSLSTISEAANDHNRGRILGFSQLLWVAGIVVNAVLVAFVGNLGSLGVAIIFGHIAIVSLITLVARLAIPESPSWTAATLEKTEGIPTVRASASSTRDLFRTPYVIPFVALIVFYSLTNLAFNTVGQYNNLVVVNYGGVDLQLAAVAGLPLLPVGIIGFLIFMKVADSPRRFTYFKFGAVLQIIWPLIYVFFGVSLWTSVLTGVLVAVAGAFAFEGIMKVWTQTSFPTLLRTTAQGTIISIARFAAAGLSFLTPVLLEAVGPRVVWGGLSVVSAVGVIWAWTVFRSRDSHNEFDTESTATPLPSENESLVTP